jgi:hypothetical protein
MSHNGDLACEMGKDGAFQAARVLSSGVPSWQKGVPAEDWLLHLDLLLLELLYELRESYS